MILSGGFVRLLFQKPEMGWKEWAIRFAVRIVSIIIATLISWVVLIIILGTVDQKYIWVGVTAFFVCLTVMYLILFRIEKMFLSRFLG